MTTRNLVAITGNTFPVKDALRALGGRWNAEAKAWMVPADKADEARAIVAGKSAPRRITFGGASQTVRCPACGKQVAKLDHGACAACQSWFAREARGGQY